MCKNYSETLIHTLHARAAYGASTAALSPSAFASSSATARWRATETFCVLKVSHVRADHVVVSYSSLRVFGVVVACVQVSDPPAVNLTKVQGSGGTMV